MYICTICRSQQKLQTILGFDFSVHSGRLTCKSNQSIRQYKINQSINQTCKSYQSMRLTLWEGLCGPDWGRTLVPTQNHKSGWIWFDFYWFDLIWFLLEDIKLRHSANPKSQIWVKEMRLNQTLINVNFTLVYDWLIDECYF